MVVEIITAKTRFCYEYEIAGDYKKYTVKVLKDDEDLSYVLEKSRKAIMFVGNRERGKKLTEKQNAMNNNSAEFLEAKDIAVSKTASSLENFHRFKSKFLFVTKVLDVGVSIEDPQIDSIIIDPTCRTNFLQMLARVRLQKCQHPNIYIFQSDAKFFENRVEQNSNLAKLAYELLKQRKNEVKEFAARISLGEVDIYTPEMLQKFTFKDSNGQWRINELTCIQTLIDYDFYSTIACEIASDENAFVKTQLGWLDKKLTTKSFVAIDRQEELKKKSVK